MFRLQINYGILTVTTSWTQFEDLLSRVGARISLRDTNYRCCIPSAECLSICLHFLMVLEFRRQKRTLSTLQCKYLNIDLTPELTRTHSTAQVEPSGFLRLTQLGPDSLYPWRADYTLLSNSAIHINR
ncbi:hypothetical protein AMECASPLE_028841 [Ameca splendens]|uniref:Uncharacterized protein n=1 Tax=Ameca splendens TaxID=208324 RepID=A0ABV0XIK8_9TELE